MIATIVVGSRIEAVLTVGVGSNHGVAPSWTAALPDQPQASVRMLRVDKAVTLLKVSGVAMDAIRGGGIAVFCP